MVQLETPRLVLRSFTEDDLPALHQVFGDPEVMRWVPSGVSQDLEHSRARLAKIIQHEQDNGFSLWALLEKETGELVGDAGLWLVEGEGPDVELAYHLLPSRWGRGYVSEAAAECVRFGLHDLGLDEVIAISDPGHFVSRRVMEKIGMSFTGLEHRYDRKMAVYSISRLDPPA